MNRYFTLSHRSHAQTHLVRRIRIYLCHRRWTEVMCSPVCVCLAKSKIRNYIGWCGLSCLSVCLSVQSTDCRLRFALIFMKLNHLVEVATSWKPIVFEVIRSTVSRINRHFSFDSLDIYVYVNTVDTSKLGKAVKHS